MNFRFKRLSITALVMSFSLVSFGQGGMWPTYMLEQKAQDLLKAGISIPVDKIYNEQHPALNDAVLLFNGGCTGEVVSAKGLLFTNHHCGYSTAQKLSTKENNYLVDGFWAKDRESELPCEGLKVAFLRKLQNVSDFVFSDLADTMSLDKRSEIIKRNIAILEKVYSKTSDYKTVIKSYYSGNEYWVSFYEEYTDVRMVGFPPNGVGKFGGDTDNWMWPRHTGDFSVFRIYADKDNKPAAYSPTNVPYTPKKYLTISTKGVQEGDMTMVYGFPYSTRQYLTSFEVDQVQNIINPLRVNARSARLAAFEKTMRTSDDVFLKYASKQSSTSNGWKKWRGEIRGMKMNDVIKKKEKFERSFQADADMTKNGNELLLPQIQSLISANNNVLAAYYIYREYGMSVEAISNAKYIDQVLKYYRVDSLTNDMLVDSLKQLNKKVTRFFKDYDVPTDMNVFDTMMPAYFETIKIGGLPVELKEMKKNSGGTFASWKNALFSNTIMTNQSKFQNIINRANKADSLLLKKDPAYLVYKSIIDHKEEHILPQLKAYQKRLNDLKRRYTKAYVEEVGAHKLLYPDANQTLRLSYGPIAGIKPYGKKTYSYLTNLDEVIAKTDHSVSEFNTPAKLIDLHRTKNYGRWNNNGTVPVAFISQNHTSGGNSGSPVLNSKGELIGINFDRVWDGVMSDIYYDPRLSRNISVDIRYVLFIIEKLGEAEWILDELKLN